MIRLADVPPSETARARLAEAAGAVSAAEHQSLSGGLPEAAARARAISGHWNFCAPADAILALINTLPGVADPAVKARLQRAAVARLILEHFEIEDRMPASVLELYDAQWNRTASFLEGVTGAYDEDYFAKDVRNALGVTVPCGTLSIDLSYRLGPKLIARDAWQSRSLASLKAYIAASGWGRWYTNHLDLRAMREFNPAGWTACFRRKAEVLALNPSVRGITGVSWFYDPKVAEISPNLAYFQEPQTSQGAFLVRLGTDAHHIANATVRSATRKQLYEQGLYMPTCYLIAWPREPLLQWAERVKTQPSLGFEGWAGAERAPPKGAAA